MKKPHIVAFILARKGSKRLRNKNLKTLFDKTSLVEATIKFAKKLKFVDNIVLSSDHKKILQISKKEKILSPGLRPKNLSGSQISSEKIVQYLLDWYEKKVKKIDGILLLQPTTPFRSISFFNKAYKIFLKKKFPIVSVSKSFKNPNNFIFKNKKIFKIKKYNEKKDPLFFIDGSLYFIQKKLFFKKKTFVPNYFYPLINKKIKFSLDIDYLHDLKIAKLMRNQNF